MPLLKMTDYAIILEKGAGNYSAYCPDLPGVVAAGETEEETAELMKEAIEFHLEGLRKCTSHPSADGHSQKHKSERLAVFLPSLKLPASRHHGHVTAALDLRPAASAVAGGTAPFCTAPMSPFYIRPKSFSFPPTNITPG